MNCPYCSSEVQEKSEEVSYCSFCDMSFKNEYLIENGKRSHFFEIRGAVFKNYLNKKTAELKSLHTFNLLELLNYARKERGREYSLLSTLNKGIDQGGEEYKTAAKEQGRNYEYYTRKAWIIENILLSRMGWFPQRITQNFLDDYKKRCFTSIKKDMKISKTRKRVVK